MCTDWIIFTWVSLDFNQRGSDDRAHFLPLGSVPIPRINYHSHRPARQSKTGPWLIFRRDSFQIRPSWMSAASAPPSFSCIFSTTGPILHLRLFQPCWTSANRLFVRLLHPRTLPPPPPPPPTSICFVIGNYYGRRIMMALLKDKVIWFDSVFLFLFLLVRFYYYVVAVLFVLLFLFFFLLRRPALQHWAFAWLSGHSRPILLQFDSGETLRRVRVWFKSFWLIFFPKKKKSYSCWFYSISFFLNKMIIMILNRNKMKKKSLI